MANVKIKAPIGYHFMINGTDSSDFYLMGTAVTGYKKHTAGAYSSALSIDIELKSGHTVDTTTQRRATATSSSGRTITTRTVAPVRTSYNPSSSGSSSSGSSSSGSSGGY